jgi:hypothetical protein
MFCGSGLVVTRLLLQIVGSNITETPTLGALEAENSHLRNGNPIGCSKLCGLWRERKPPAGLTSQYGGMTRNQKVTSPSKKSRKI